jgi:hypothetical protein
MSQGIVWKSCTGACMDITSPAKYFCVNCENHDSTCDVVEEEFEVQQNNNEFELEGVDWESRMLFMEEQMKKWTIEMEEAIAADFADYTEDTFCQETSKEDLAHQIIHLVKSWHLGIERELYSKRMENLRNAMAQAMLESSLNKIKYISKMN